MNPADEASLKAALGRGTRGHCDLSSPRTRQNSDIVARFPAGNTSHPGKKESLCETKLRAGRDRPRDEGAWRRARSSDTCWRGARSVLFAASGQRQGRRACGRGVQRPCPALLAGEVLSRKTGYNRSDGRNPYVGYDDVDSSPFLYSGPDTPGDLPPMARVITVDSEEEPVAYPYDVLRESPAVNDVVDGKSVAVVWQEGTASALDEKSIDAGRDVAPRGSSREGSTEGRSRSAPREAASSIKRPAANGTSSGKPWPEN